MATDPGDRAQAVTIMKMKLIGDGMQPDMAAEVAEELVDLAIAQRGG